MPDFIIIESHIFTQPIKSSKTNVQLTDSLLTPYEYAKILSERAREIRVGSPYNVEWAGNFDPIAIAMEEIKQKKLDRIIERSIPDGTCPSGFRIESLNLQDVSVRDY
jgi:DNA-directed RNA polymerase subunit K/omega